MLTMDDFYVIYTLTGLVPFSSWCIYTVRQEANYYNEVRSLHEWPFVFQLRHAPGVILGCEALSIGKKAMVSESEDIGTIRYSLLPTFIIIL